MRGEVTYLFVVVFSACRKNLNIVCVCVCVCVRARVCVCVSVYVCNCVLLNLLCVLYLF